MFKYINMPKLLAHYLREFSVRSDGTPSLLYKFLFCLCLPFLPPKSWRFMRLRALAIAECGISADQIRRVFSAVTGGATLYIVTLYQDYETSFDGTSDTPTFTFTPDDPTTEVLSVTWGSGVNETSLFVQLNGTSKTQAEATLKLLIPFWIETMSIEYV